MTIFKISSKKAKEPKSAVALPDEEGSTGSEDHILLRVKGNNLMIPRGDMSEKKWLETVDAASRKANFVRAVTGGDTVEAPEPELGEFESPKRATEPAPMVRPALKPPQPDVLPPVESLPDMKGGDVPEIQPFVEPDVPKILPPENVRSMGAIDPATNPHREKSFGESVVEGAGNLADTFAQGGSSVAKAIGAGVEGANEAIAGAAGTAAQKLADTELRFNPLTRGIATGRPTDAYREVGALVGSSPNAALANTVAAGQKSVSGAPKASPTTAPPGTPSGSQMTSMKVRGSTGPSGGPGEALPSLDPAEQEFQASQQLAVQTASQAAEAQLRERVAHEARLRDFDAEQAASKNRQREAEDSLNNAYMKTLEESDKKMQIDPHHFWESRTDGQKAMILIGGFLAGIGGKDPTAIIDGMVKRDIDVQRENFNLAREDTKTKLAGLDNMYARLRNRGLNDQEAAAATRAAMNEGFASRMKSISEQMAPGEAQSKALFAMSQFRMNKVKAEDELKNSRSERFARSEALRLRNFELELKQRNDAAKLAAKGAKGPHVPNKAREEMLKLEDSIKNIDRMIADVPEGPLARGGARLAQLAPGGGLLFPETVAQADDFSLRAYTLATDAAKSALQKEEMKVLFERIPQHISGWKDPVPQLKIMREFMKDALKRREEEYGREGTPDPENEKVQEQEGP